MTDSSINNPFKMLWSWWKNLPPSWEYTDKEGIRWRVTMITPFDAFYERLYE